MAEKEYIEREALIAEIDRNEPSNWTDTEAEIQSILDYRLYKGIAISQPAADVVVVVRCKDCAVPHNKWTGCPHLNGLIPPPDHYCARGERKCADELEETKSEAIKEFAERLKCEMLGKYCLYFNAEITDAIIDNLVKEMTEEQK